LKAAGEIFALGRNWCLRTKKQQEEQLPAIFNKANIKHLQANCNTLTP